MKDIKTKSIFSTTDYAMFKLLKKQNRSLKEGHVLKIMKSVRKKNLLLDFPIIVSKDFHILDGQHRYETCKRLEIPVYYVISDTMTIDDIPIINSIYFGWKLEDYLSKYLDMDNIHYINFKNFMDKYSEFNVGTCIKLICGYDYGGGGGVVVGAGVANCSPSKKFKLGEFVYPSNDNFAHKKVRMIKSFSPYTPVTGTFISAVVSLMKITGYDHDRMLKSLNARPDLLKQAGSVNAYFSMFNELYNHRIRKSENTVYLKSK